MSFNANDINLGNYEEFFILYMDNELTAGQKKMVEDFLLIHPHLQAELDMLLSTKLPAEAFSFNKDALLADSMKLSAVDEELLLYIDNELPEGKKKMVEEKLISSPAYQQQHQQLLQTRLDVSEVISYPHKKELYRRRERVVAFKPWMRTAAAVIVLAAMGALYVAGDHAAPGVPPARAEVREPRPGTQPARNGTRLAVEPSQQPAMAAGPAPKSHPVEQAAKERTARNHEVKFAAQPLTDGIAHTAAEDPAGTPPLAGSTTAIALNSNRETATASLDPKEILNNSAVTSALSQRNTTINATTPPVPGNDVADNKERKGSFKSFLRKATRLIERKTGIDPTSGEEDELLIGAVAVKLK